MAIKWNPAIYKGGTLTLLPRPVSSLKVSDSWDSRESKVPLKDGGTLDGVSFNMPTISVAGSFAIDASDNEELCSEEDQFDAYEALRAAVDVSDDNQKFEFFTHHDATGGSYRKFKKCVPVSFETEFGDDEQVLFVYNLTIKAEDPTIYKTAPGA